ncbi:MAG: hypothetical protein IJB49_07595 [Clostridia bacterium]|nr:hypothetical protein [Clostridia bacterium]
MNSGFPPRFWGVLRENPPKYPPNLTEAPDNETLTVNGETYVHWYDCITDYIL